EERGRALLAEAHAVGTWSQERRRKSAPCGGGSDEFAQAVPPPPDPAAVAAFEVIMAGCRMPLPEALAVEEEAFVRLVGSAQARETIAAFFSKQGRKLRDASAKRR